MRAVVHDLVDTFAPAGACEFMGAFADRYPPRVMFELLGIPDDEQDCFLEWGKELVFILSYSVAEHRVRMEAAMAGLYGCTDRLCDERRRHPRDDLFSALVAAGDGEDGLTLQELRSFVVVMVVAGQDSTRNQLGLALHTFARHPEQWALLARHPELAERAVEDAARVSPVVPIVWRVAAEDVVYRGLPISTGTRLWLLVGAAQTEPATFGADSFDITAELPPILTFGTVSTTAWEPRSPEPRYKRPFPSWRTGSRVWNWPVNPPGVPSWPASSDRSHYPSGLPPPSSSGATPIG
jgi:cytochrome P450